MARWTRMLSGAAVFALMAACAWGGVPDEPEGAEVPVWGICTSVKNAAGMKELGYGYVEEGVKRTLIPEASDEAFADKLRQVKASPLPVRAYNGFLPSSLRVTGPKTDHDRILKYAGTAFKRAKEIGSKIVVFGSGGSRRLPSGFAYEEGFRQFTELLKKMGPIAATCDVTVVIEPLNKTECNFINSVREGTDLAKAVDHPSIRVLADLYHMAKEGEGPESIRYAGELLRHCHIAELKGRSVPGTHRDDFTGYFRALKEIGYRGGISVEARWKDFNKQMPEAIAYLKEQWAAAGKP